MVECKQPPKGAGTASPQRRSQLDPLRIVKTNRVRERMDCIWSSFIGDSLLILLFNLLTVLLLIPPTVLERTEEYQPQVFMWTPVRITGRKIWKPAWNAEISESSHSHQREHPTAHDQAVSTQTTKQQILDQPMNKHSRAQAEYQVPQARASQTLSSQEPQSYRRARTKIRSPEPKSQECQAQARPAHSNEDPNKNHTSPHHLPSTKSTVRYNAMTERSMLMS